ncbi:MAG: tRNA (adenosine(37)-N6)-threonylcarbamoyltransferase complex ATPase subunit type 1 TsaE [Paludibacteraceae bacterium]|nr:tRNA (adenosine(37)-N6)-threonylcarbamoyltransferase complex ATPase subunit type 1 TsaE [Paludibacteraceae bacterium]
MKEYRLLQTDSGLKLTDKSGVTVPATDILTLFPEKRVYAFYGQMGAGKTTFIKQLSKEMGIEDVVNSPTFAIVNVYEWPKTGNHAAAEDVYHFDCYRLKNLQEALDLGAEEYLYSGCYCFIEWPEMIEELLPEETVRVRIRVEENHRVLEIS